MWIFSSKRKCRAAESNRKICEIEKLQNIAIPREEIIGFEPKELLPQEAPGSGGIKGHRKSKKDKLRESAGKVNRR